MKKLTSVILIAAMVVAIIPSLAITTEVNANPIVLSNRTNEIINPSPQLTPEALQWAFNADLLGFSLTHPESGNLNWEVNRMLALFYLSYAANLDPATQSADGVYAADRAVAHIRHLIYGGREHRFDSGPFLASGILPNSLLMARKTPAVWYQLTEDEIERVDLLMEVSAIMANWGFNDFNNYFTGFGLRGNFNKSWNPNFRVKGICAIIAASLYFGGADELNAILAAFDEDEFFQRLYDAGFTNIYTRWSYIRNAYPGIMENGGPIASNIHLRPNYTSQTAYRRGGIGAGVRVPFRYHGYPLSNIEGIVYRLMVGTGLGAMPAPAPGLTTVPRPPGTYDRIVQDRWECNRHGWACNGSYAYTMGGVSSPFLGLRGSFYEFSTLDGSGFRSETLYGVFSMLVVVPFMINIAMFYDGWDGSTLRQQQVHRQIHIGHEDLIFKLHHGFRSWSHGGRHTHTGQNWAGHGYLMLKDLWRMALGFHDTPTFMPPSAGAGPAPAMSPPRFTALNITPAGTGVTINGWNHSSEPLEAAIILAMFDEDNKLLNLFASNLSIPAETGMFSNPVNFGSPAPTRPPEARYIRAFIWEDFAGMTPLF